MWPSSAAFFANWAWVPRDNSPLLPLPLPLFRPGRTKNRFRKMGRTKNHIRNKKKQQHQQTDPSNSNQPHSYPRKSYYFSRELDSHDKFCNSPKSIDPPRKSSKRIRSRKLSTAAAAARTSPKTVSTPVSAGCSCRANLWTKPESPRQSCSSDGGNESLETEDEVPNFSPEFRTDRILTTDSFDDMVAWSRSESDAKDIVIDVKRIELPPIITKSEKFDDSVKDLKKSPKHHRSSQISAKEQRNSTSTARKSTSSSPRMKLRIHSPKIANRKISQGRKSGSGSRRSLSESLAVVKSSADPQKDFRESMVEMIVQNNLRASKDLEDLLACYLTLNSDEYHERGKDLAQIREKKKKRRRKR